MPSREVALEESNALNTSICRIKRQDIDPVLIAVVAEWPHSADSHAAGLMIRDECLRMRGDQAVAARAATAAVAVPDDFELRERWRAAGGSFHGPCVETGTMPEAQLLPFLRDLAATPALPATEDSSAGDLAEGPDGFGSAEHWKEKAQYWAGVAHELRGQALRGEPVDGIIQPTSQAEVQAEPVIYVSRGQLETHTDPDSDGGRYLPARRTPLGLLNYPLYSAPQAQPADALDAARYRHLRDGVMVDGEINESLYVRVDQASYPNRWALVGQDLDEAIDAAMAAAQEGGNASAGKDGAA